MSKKKKLTKDEVLHLGKLSTLELTEKEIEKYDQQLTETLNYIENLNELETDNVEITNQVTNLMNVTFEDGKKCERMFTEAEAMQNSKTTKNGYFKVKRIL